MKSFYLAISAFALLLIIIGINFVYVNSKSDELIAMVEELPSPEDAKCRSAVDALQKKWEECERIFQFSAVRTELNAIGDSIMSLKAYCKGKDSVEFEHHRELLLSAIQEVRRLESFRFGSVF